MNLNILGDIIEYLNEKEYSPNTSGGNEASLGIPLFIKGITFDKYALAYNINKWSNCKGCNLHSPLEKYLGEIPKIGEIVDFYHYDKNKNLINSKLIRLDNGLFEVIE